jgi:histidine phosphotransferase ChpT
MTPIDLASLMCSRLCHDLVNPLGALLNGVELLAEEDDPAMRAQAIELLEISARQSNNKLKFFRLAFGAAGGLDTAVDVREVRAALDALLAESKITLDCRLRDSSLPKGPVKVLLNLALLGAEGLVRGGTLTVMAEASPGGFDVAVQAEGTRVFVSEDVRRVLAGEAPADGVNAKIIPAHLVHLLVAERKGKLSVNDGSDGRFAAAAHIPA